MKEGYNLLMNKINKDNKKDKEKIIRKIKILPKK